MSGKHNFQRTTLLINSKYRVNPSGTTSTNFIYRFPQKVNNVVHINLLQAVIENGVYNITNLNDTFVLTLNPTAPVPSVFNISIPIGYYDDASYTTAIADAMNRVNTLAPGGNQSTFFCDINNAGKLSITNDLSRDWTISFTSIQTGTAKIMGFNATTVYQPLLTTNGPYTVVSNNKVRLANFDYLLIQSDKLNNDIQSNQNFNAWWSILNGNELTNSTTITYINYRSPVFEVLVSPPRDIEWVDIRICDSSGQQIDIRDNNIQLLVELYTDDTARK